MRAADYIRLVLVVMFATEVFCLLAIIDSIQRKHVWWQWLVITALIGCFSLCSYYVKLR